MSMEDRKIKLALSSPALFSDDPLAIEELERCDYTQKITMKIAKAGEAKRPIRIYADGIYDLFHQGHARQLLQAKAMFESVYLIVGCCSDRLTHEKKGQTVMTDDERYEALRHCRYVDEIIKDAPWELTAEFLEQHKIDFVAHDDEPYGSEDAEDIYKWIKDKDMFATTQRTEGVSTSDLIARIVRDYDSYVRRNLERGYTAKQLNVSFLREKKLMIQDKMDALKRRGNDFVENLGEKKDEIITKWEEKSRDFIQNFLELFGPAGALPAVCWTPPTQARVAVTPSTLPSELLVAEDSPTIGHISFKADSLDSPPELSQPVSTRDAAQRHGRVVSDEPRLELQ